ncbi:unnamed protein product [Prunus armeniaca]|uniref:Uncharacterized protein n=1 Tax=Prunus armeniaca TaxID=36596 RepID=A0A6J5Y6U6_PRUAR|nr:unnamed protein product [Prunus armeniaca]
MGLIKRVLFRHGRTRINQKSNVITSNALTEAIAKGLSVLRKKHLLRASLAAKHSSQSSWCPALQRIREEI